MLALVNSIQNDAEEDKWVQAAEAAGKRSTPEPPVLLGT